METEIKYTPYVSTRFKKITPSQLNIPNYLIQPSTERVTTTEVPTVSTSQPSSVSSTPVQSTPAADETKSQQVESTSVPDIVQTKDSSFDGSDTSRAGKSRNARNYLASILGLNKTQASGLIGIFLSESQLNENAENKGEKKGSNPNVKSNQYGIGINQWTHGRHDDFMNGTKTNGSSLKSQLDFAADEIKRKYPEFLAALRQADDIDEATAYAYAMYTVAENRNMNKSNGRDIVEKTNKRQQNFAAAHNYKEPGFAGRLQHAKEALSYKLGGIVGFQSGGSILVEPDPEPYEYKGFFNNPLFTGFSNNFQKLTKHKEEREEALPFSEDEMMKRQHYAETRFRGDLTSGAGAKGHFQIIPATGNGVVDTNKLGNLDINKFEDNKLVRDYYMKYLSNRPFISKAKDTVKTALTYAAYNMGEGKLKRFIDKEKDKGVDVYANLDWIDDLNPETKRYVNFIVRGIEANADGTNDAFNKALSKTKYYVKNN